MSERTHDGAPLSEGKAGGELPGASTVRTETGPYGELEGSPSRPMGKHLREVIRLDHRPARHRRQRLFRERAACTSVLLMPGSASSCERRLPGRVCLFRTVPAL